MQRMRTPEEMKLSQGELDKMDLENANQSLNLRRRIEELEAALRSALYYIKRIGDDGEGGTSDHAVTLDTIQQALRKRTEFIQTAADTKTTLWPTNLDPTSWR